MLSPNSQLPGPPFWQIAQFPAIVGVSWRAQASNQPQSPVELQPQAYGRFFLLACRGSVVGKKVGLPLVSKKYEAQPSDPSLLQGQGLVCDPWARESPFLIHFDSKYPLMTDSNATQKLGTTE